MPNLLRYALGRVRALAQGRAALVQRAMAARAVLRRNGVDVTPRDTRGSPREIYGRRHRLSVRQWLLYHQHRVIFEQPSWMGVRIWKSPLDIWIYQEIIHEVRPDVIVEIGSASGGSTLYLAHLLDLIGEGRVVSIDIDRSSYHVTHPRITAITGDSGSPAVVAQVAEICRGRSALVIHDGDHRKEQVLRDLELYAGFVTPGSYFIVEDGIVDLFEPDEMTWVKAEGPLAAIEEFVKKNKNFVVDLDRERYLITYNPRGYLRRVS